MFFERNFSTEAKRAMFWALSVARCAGEPHVTSGRIASAILSSSAGDEPGTVPSAECRRIIDQQLAEAGIEIGSRAHLDSVQPLPVAPVLKQVIDTLVFTPGEDAITPEEILSALVAADDSLRERLAR